MRPKYNGFTIVEMLTVIAVIAVLVGLLLPATTVVRHMARNVKQRSQFTAIGLGLEAFKQDFGYYPPSNAALNGTGNQAFYTGSQKLAEAMIGRDLLGYNEKSDLVSTDGVDAAVDLANRPYPLQTEVTPDIYQDNLKQRKNLYVELATANAFRVYRENGFGLYDNPLLLKSNPLYDSYVLCDEFARKSVTMPDGSIVKAGSPILYYRANPSHKTIQELDNINALGLNTYDMRDNDYLVYDVRRANGEITSAEPMTCINSSADTSSWQQRAVFFYKNKNSAVSTGGTGYIQDPKVVNYPTAYKSDSYLLISAGLDGLYGTADDITNFGN